MQRIRKFSSIPNIMLSARDGQGIGSELGADDYETLEPKELIAR